MSDVMLVVCIFYVQSVVKKKISPACPGYSYLKSKI